MGKDSETMTANRTESITGDLTGEQGASRLGPDWRETSPGVYEKISYSPEQIKKLNERPDALIKAALDGARRP